LITEREDNREREREKKKLAKNSSGESLLEIDIIIVYSIHLEGRDSSVGIGTDYRLYGRGVGV
jgi:hypothetical protein